MVEPNRQRYLASLAGELSVQATRVRDLIGDAHWISDGRHKESLLGSLLTRHLPTGVRVAPGFVISPYDESICSTEQDVLLVDTLVEQPVLDQSGLIIAFPRNVLAAISVKTVLGRTEIADAIRGLHSAWTAIKAEPLPTNVWYGAFFFESSPPIETDPTKLHSYITSALTNGEGSKLDSRCVDFIACAQKYACRFTHKEDAENSNASRSHLNAFNCGETATSFFLAHLLDHVTYRRGGPEGQLLASLDSVSTVAIQPSHIDL